MCLHHGTHTRTKNNGVGNYNIGFLVTVLVKSTGSKGEDIKRSSKYKYPKYKFKIKRKI